MSEWDIKVDIFDKKRISIDSTNVFRDRELILTLPGARYDTKNHRFLAPLTWATCVAVRGIFGERLQIGESLASWAWDERNTRIDPAIKLRQAWDAEGDDDLYPFQRAGVQFLKYAKRALLCDEMGTGKTVQTIRTLKSLHDDGEDPFPALVVAPNNMTLTWKKEIEKWWPGRTAVVIKGSAAKRKQQIAEKADFHIINWESVRIHSKLESYGSNRLKRCIVCDPTLADTPTNKQSRCEWCKKELNQKEWKTIIVDEAHRMKNPNAKQTQAVWALQNSETKYVYALTGTPIANAPHDFWPSLKMVAPDEWPSRSRYMDRYCLLSYNIFGGMNVVGLREETKAELFSIVDPRMRRMPKEAVLPFLPKKTYTERYVDMTTKQKKAYDQMADQLISVLGDAVAVAVNPLTQMTRMMQFASAFAEIDPTTGEVRLSDPSNKVDALVDLLDEMGEEPAVVFAQSRQLIELAAKRLDKEKISYTMIVGGQSADEREASKTSFQDGKVRVILCTIAAGGIGITLTRAGTAIFLQRSWSMVDNAQAEDRVHRIGSEIHDKINIVDILSIGTLEERQRLVLSTKEERLEEVLRDRDTLARLLKPTD